METRTVSKDDVASVTLSEGQLVIKPTRVRCLHRQARLSGVCKYFALFVPTARIFDAAEDPDNPAYIKLTGAFHDRFHSGYENGVDLFIGPWPETAAPVASKIRDALGLPPHLEPINADHLGTLRGETWVITSGTRHVTAPERPDFHGSKLVFPKGAHPPDETPANITVRGLVIPASDVEPLVFQLGAPSHPVLLVKDWSV